MSPNLDGDVSLPSMPTWQVLHEGTANESHELDMDHGLQDAKQRHIGGHAMIQKMDKDFRSPLTQQGQKPWRLIVVPTRDSEIYSSARSFSFHATLEQARAQGLLKLQEQGRSYHKKYGAPSA
jgi:hypothetical protein